MLDVAGSQTNRVKAFGRGEALWLLLIVALGASLRTYIWFHGFALNGIPGLVRHGDGYLAIAATFAPGNDAAFFEHWRSWYQFIYPLYLAPIFAFELNDGVYVFWLHHAFAAATIVLIYMSSRRLFGVACAMLAAGVYALHVQFAYWFNWAFADTAYHFHLSVFLYLAVACWSAFSVRKAIGLTACAFVMCFTRPEGIVVTAAFSAAVSFWFLSGRLGVWRALAAVSAVAFCATVALTVVLVQSKPVREAVLSNVGVGWGLYYGSHRTPTRAENVNDILNEMRRIGIERAAVDPEHRNQWYWSSMAGLERIREHRMRYLGYSAERLINAIGPSFFREGVSLRYKLIDRTMAVFLIVGLAVTLAARHRMSSLIRSLAFSALAVYLLVSFYQSEWDVRVQLSAHVFLIPIASFGWILVVRRARTWLSAAKEDAVLANPGKDGRFVSE